MLLVQWCEVAVKHLLQVRVVVQKDGTFTSSHLTFAMKLTKR